MRDLTANEVTRLAVRHEAPAAVWTHWCEFFGEVRAEAVLLEQLAVSDKQADRTPAADRVLAERAEAKAEHELRKTTFDDVQIACLSKMDPPTDDELLQLSEGETPLRMLLAEKEALDLARLAVAQALVK